MNTLEVVKVMNRMIDGTRKARIEVKIVGIRN